MENTCRYADIRKWARGSGRDTWSSSGRTRPDRVPQMRCTDTVAASEVTLTIVRNVPPRVTKSSPAELAWTTA